MRSIHSILFTLALLVTITAAAHAEKKHDKKKNAEAKKHAAAVTVGNDAQPAKPKQADVDASPFKSELGSKELPTFIKSDSLTLRSEERIFIYTGNVEVRRGEMIMTSESLEGVYDQNNKIQTLTAKKNVTVTKGDAIKATGDQALYTAADETMVLSQSPELQQNDSVLTADTIRIFMKENRSVAEGAVRVKLVKKETPAPGK